MTKKCQISKTKNPVVERNTGFGLIYITGKPLLELIPIFGFRGGIEGTCNNVKRVIILCRSQTEQVGHYWITFFGTI